MQSFSRHVQKEMAFLWFAECTLVFFVSYGLIFLSSTPDPALLITPGHAINLAAMLALTIGISAVLIGIYRTESCREPRRLLRDLILAGVLAFPALLVISQVANISLSENYLLWLTKGLFAWIFCILATRWAISLAMRQSMFMRRVWIVGTGLRAQHTSDLIQSRHGGLFKVVSAADAAEFMTVGPTNAPLMADRLRASRVWGIVVTDDEDMVGDDLLRDGSNRPQGDCLLKPDGLLDLKLRGIRVFNDRSFWEQHLGKINLGRIDTRWLMFSDGFSNTAPDRFVKRACDLVFSFVLLIVTLPLMLIVAILIKLDSPGTLFYRQERVGLHGRHFTVFKFRSMTSDAERGGKPLWASQKDSRITRIGSFIRSTRIDELPQLMNVVRGEMSFIGPRPERPHFVEQLTELIPFYDKRSYVKPGITGWAQVNFPYGASVEDAREKLSYDLYYVKNYSVLLDIVILLATVRVILFQEGSR